MTDDQPLSNRRRSSELVDGSHRAGARAMLRAAGYGDDALTRPIIGVCTTWIETMPCNLNQRALARRVKAGIRAAGGTPMEFNTIAISDGISMGTRGMRASLPSRETIADSIELVAEGHLFDGLVCLVGCDKTIPGAAMALGRLDIPGMLLYSGSMAPGRWQGRDVSIQDVYEAIGAFNAGKLSADELEELERSACPGVGACAGQFTANTMAMAIEFLGLSPNGYGEIPAAHPTKAARSEEAGELAMSLVTGGVRPSRIVTKSSIENAVVSIAASGGSTNGVLHMLAIAHDFAIPFSIDEFDAISARTPVIADLRPSGRFLATDLFQAGGVAVLMRALAACGLLDESAATLSGRTLGDIAKEAAETPGQKVVVSGEEPIKRRGGIAILRGNLAPDGCVVKLSASGQSKHRGRARVFDSEQDAFTAVSAGSILPGDVVIIRYVGPAGGPGMPEMLQVTGAIVGAGLSDDVVLFTDGRFSGASRGFVIGHASPEAAKGGPIAAVREGDVINVNVDRRSIEVELSDEEIASRLAARPAPPARLGGALGKYARLVGSASEGAVTCN